MTTKKATKWYWIYGVAYCPRCVKGTSTAMSGGGAAGSCLTRHERTKAMRDVVTPGRRCHCCHVAAR